MSDPFMSSSRRKVLQLLFGGSLAALAASALYGITKFILPLPEKIISVIVGSASNWTDAMPVKQVKLGMKDVLVVRTGDNAFTALDLKCTHAGCTVHWIADAKMFRCPCHGGQYDATGKVIKGPPPRPLARVQVEIDKHGDVVVTDIPV